MDRDEFNFRRNEFIRTNYQKITMQDCNTENSDGSQRRHTNLGGKANMLAQKVAALSNSGLTQRKIAELLCISISSVNKFLNMKYSKTNN